MTQKDVSDIIEKKSNGVNPLEWEVDTYRSRYSVPNEVRTAFHNGRFGGDSIRPQWIIESLTNMFGLCGYGWYYDVVRTWTESSESEVKSFVEINLYYRIRCASGNPSDDVWSKPVHGTGGNTLSAGGKKMDDDCFKKAETDALSKACQKLGIAGEVYMGTEVDKYTDPSVNTLDKSKESRHSEALDRNKCIDIISERFIEPAFRAKLKEYVRMQNKNTHDELTDTQLVEFITSQNK